MPGMPARHRGHGGVPQGTGAMCRGHVPASFGVGVDSVTDGFGHDSVTDGFGHDSVFGDDSVTDGFGHDSITACDRGGGNIFREHLLGGSAVDPGVEPVGVRGLVVEHAVPILEVDLARYFLPHEVRTRRRSRPAARDSPRACRSHAATNRRWCARAGP